MTSAILLVSVAALGCAQEQTPPPPPANPQLIAIVDTRGTATPVARYAGGVWDRPPWATPAELTRFAATSDGDGDWRWPDAARVWQGSEQELEALGSTPNAVATGVPDSWFFFSETERALPLAIRSMNLAMDGCNRMWWVFRMQEGVTIPRAAPGVLPDMSDDGIAGLALSRMPSAVLSRNDIPGIEQIRERLGFVDVPDPDGEGRRWMETRYKWLGLFHIDDMTIGVLHRVGSGWGTVNAVIEIDGDASRIVAETRRERCPAPDSRSPGEAGEEGTRLPTSDSGADALWIGVASYEGTIAPIARVADGVWSIPPWADAFYLQSIAARNTGDGVWSWPDVKEVWENPDEDPDFPGRAPDVIATGVPDSWYLFSEAQRGSELTTTSLMVERSHCMVRWALQTTRDTLPAMGMGVHPYIGGVVLSRQPSAILSADDMPALERIEEDLGLVDVTDAGKLDRRFDWLGFFRYDDLTFGVVQALYYESSDFSIVEFNGELGRVVAWASEGGC